MTTKRALANLYLSHHTWWLPCFPLLNPLHHQLIFYHWANKWPFLLQKIESFYGLQLIFWRQLDILVLKTHLLWTSNRASCKGCYRESGLSSLHILVCQRSGSVRWRRMTYCQSNCAPFITTSHADVARHSLNFLGSGKWAVLTGPWGGGWRLWGCFPSGDQVGGFGGLIKVFFPELAPQGVELQTL